MKIKLLLLSESLSKTTDVLGKTWLLNDTFMCCKYPTICSRSNTPLPWWKPGRQRVHRRIWVQGLPPSCFQFCLLGNANKLAYSYVLEDDKRCCTWHDCWHEALRGSPQIQKTIFRWSAWSFLSLPLDTELKFTMDHIFYMQVRCSL